MKTSQRVNLTAATLALVVACGAAASAGTVRIDAVQSTLPINYPVYQAVAQVPVVTPAPVLPAPVVAAPVAPAPVAVPAPVAPAPVVVQSPVIAPAPLMPAPVTTYYAPAPVYYGPAPVYYAPVRARTIIRPWGARTVYRYW